MVDFNFFEQVAEDDAFKLLSQILTIEKGMQKEYEFNAFHPLVEYLSLYHPQEKVGILEFLDLTYVCYLFAMDFPLHKHFFDVPIEYRDRFKQYCRKIQEPHRCSLRFDPPNN